MHDEALAFVTAHADEVRPGARVIEVGSYDRNGAVRHLFDHAEHYFGIDIDPGPGVDIAVPDPALWEPDWSAHAVVCTETFEHVEDWPRLLRAIARWLRPGGVLIATMAGPKRKPHAANGDGGGPKSGEHYANVTIDALQANIVAAGFAAWNIESRRGHRDVYALAWMPPGPAIPGHAISCHR